MRLHVISDLHLEFAAYTAAQVEADVVVCAGDLSTGKNGLKWLFDTFPQRPVIYVLGNHEFYGQKIPKLIDEIKAAAFGTHVHVLENSSVQIGEVIFLGATLWTDLQLNGDPAISAAEASTGMADFRKIRVSPEYRCFKPADARMRFTETTSWLRRECAALQDAKRVIVTHHAPSPASLPQDFQGSPLNPAYASDLNSFIEQSGAALWIHGHIHQSVDYSIGNTRVLSNARGYPDEKNTSFRPGLVVEI
jgi:predicted phosphodiesterase